MKLPLGLGLPVLLGLLVGAAWLGQPWQFPVLLLAMGVALWTAFSLPIKSRAQLDAEQALAAQARAALGTDVPSWEQGQMQTREKADKETGNG